MVRMLVLASLGAIIAAVSMASHIQHYPRELESLFGTKREVAAEKEKERSVCESEECKLIAKVMKDSMNESIDPCEDFYEYACGQWANNNPVPENMSTWSLWNMVQKKIDKQVEGIIRDESETEDPFATKLAKMWYQSCMDTEAEERRGVEPLLSTLWRHGGWPLIMQDGEWDSRIYNWQIVDDHFARLLGFNAFHDLRYDSVSWDDNDTILIDTPHLPARLYRLLNRTTPPISDSSDENNESGEGSQEKGSKEKGNNKEDEDDENNENEDSGVDEDLSTEDSEDTEENEVEDEEELRRKKIAGRRGHNRVGHGRKKHNKNKVLGKSIGDTKLRKRTKRDVMREKVLRRTLHHLKKHDKTKHHHNAKKTKGKTLKHGHLSTKRNDVTKGGDYKIAHSKKTGHENSVKNHHEAKEGKRRNRLSKRKNNKRLGHGRRRNNKNKMSGTHVHGRNSKMHNKKHHALNKSPNRKTHLAASKINAPRRRHVVSANDTETTDSNTENTDSNTENNNESEEEDNNVDENNNKESDDEENGDNGDDTDEDNEEDQNGSTDEDEDEDEEGDKDDDDEDNEEEDNEEEDDDEEDDDEEDDEEDDDDEENIEELREKYREFILNVSLVLAKGRGIEVPREKLEKDIADLVEFAIKLGEITLISEDDPVAAPLDSFTEAYNKLDSDINTSPNSKINWKRKIQKLYEEAGVDLEDDVEITITCQKYIRELKKLLDKTPSKTIVNYIHWIFVDKMILFSTSEVREISENWAGGSFWDSREEECIQQVEMSEIVGYAYVKKHFSDEIEKTARDMIDDIQKEVEYQIEESTWMDDDTKHFVLDKLVTMKNMVGHPSWYQNTTAVKNYFQGLTIGPSYYENIMSYIRHFKWKRLRRVLEENSHEMEMVDPLMLNAFFMPTENSITVTAADFQNPMFALNRPWNINYGIIGVIMGHEVNHGFDDEGRLYDRKGNPMEWLSAMAAAYNKRAECFVDQFNKYSLFRNENYTIENYGNQTIGENIADTMGLQAVYRAYQRRQRECKKPDPALPGLEQFNNNQIFFLSFANLWCDNEDRESVIDSASYDVHSTGRLRVIGSVSNSEDFAKAFSCPVGSPMNPEKKCNIWI